MRSTGHVRPSRRIARRLSDTIEICALTCGSYDLPRTASYEVKCRRKPSKWHYDNVRRRRPHDVIEGYASRCDTRAHMYFVWAGARAEISAL